MGKFIIIQDMRSLPCYRNVNARLLYIHVAMGCDIATYTYATSLRRLASELDMTVDTVRHALKLLFRDGLLEAETAPQTAPQSAPHGAPQTTPQKAPHLTILKIKKNGTPNGTPNTTPYTTPYTTDSTTDSTTDKKININYLKKFLTHDARARGWKNLLEKEFSLDSAAADKAIEAFLSRQRLKGKVWQSEGDALAHMVAWMEKRLPRKASPRSTAASDHDARMLEYERTKEQTAAADELTRLTDEVAKLTRWRHEAIRRKDEDQANNLAMAISELNEKITEQKHVQQEQHHGAYIGKARTGT